MIPKPEKCTEWFGFKINHLATLVMNPRAVFKGG
jgi:hypothetical protein